MTGASGFIGSWLVPRLVEQGIFVRTFGRSNKAPRYIRDLGLEKSTEHMGGDVTNFEQVSDVVRGCDTVFHLAGLVSYRSADLVRQYAVNVVGTHNIMQQALRHCVKRVIHTSSVAALGIPSPGAIGDER